MLGLPAFRAFETDPMIEMRHDWRKDDVVALFELPINDLLFDAHSVHRTHHQAWRSPTRSQVDAVCEIVTAVKDFGMETCVTLGMLTAEQAVKLADAGLDFYNHNLDASPEYYAEIITTRTYSDRLETLAHVRDAEVKVCCGGIVGMGESRADRAGLLMQLANLPRHPESDPINQLVRVEGTPLFGSEPLSAMELLRTVAVARILMPQSVVRLSAGRTELSEEAQVLCFFAGAGLIFCGDRLLTTPNPQLDEDAQMFEDLGLTRQQL